MATIEMTAAKTCVFCARIVIRKQSLILELNKSGWRDSNTRFLVPKTSGMANLPYTQLGMGRPRLNNS